MQCIIFFQRIGGSSSKRTDVQQGSCEGVHTNIVLDVIADNNELQHFQLFCQFYLTKIPILDTIIIHPQIASREIPSVVFRLPPAKNSHPHSGVPQNTSDHSPFRLGLSFSTPPCVRSSSNQLEARNRDVLCLSWSPVQVRAPSGMALSPAAEELS